MRAQVLPFRFTPFDVAILSLVCVFSAAVLILAFSNIRRPAYRVASQAQLTAVAAACESYILAFGEAPGYFADANLRGTNLTGSENMMLSLMGGVIPAATAPTPAPGPLPATPPGWVIDPSAVGTGPRSLNGNPYGMFYSPKPNELFAVTGTTKPDNTIPEFVCDGNGMPILYYRIDPNRTTDNAGNWYDGSVSLGRETNGDYFNAASLTGPNGAVNQTGSLLRASQPGGAAAANLLMTRIATNAKLGIVGGSFVLISPGPDGVWFEAAQEPTTFPPTLDDYADSFDDHWRIGG